MTRTSPEPCWRLAESFAEAAPRSARATRGCMSTAAFALRYVAAANQLAPISSALWVEASDVNGRRAALIVGDLVRVGHETVAQSSQDRWIRAGIFTCGSAG